MPPVQRDITATIASAYRLSTSKLTLSDLNKDLPGLESLLKHKRKLRKLWQVTRDQACKTAVNWIAKTIRRMARKKAQEWCERVGTLRSYLKLCGHCEIAYRKGRIKSTNRCSWPFRNNTSSEQKSQHDCGFLRSVKNQLILKKKRIFMKSSVN
jgi:hypothetical protein